MTFKTLAQCTPPSPDSTTLPTVGQQTPSITPLATQRARLLLGCYRLGEAADPEIYAAGVAAMLSAYPEDIAVAVTDPITGVAAKSKFLPTLSEVREACEAAVEKAMLPQRMAEAREDYRRRIRAQLDERAHIDERQAATDPDRVRREADKFIAEVKADLGRPKSSNDMTIAEAELKLAHTKPIPKEILERDLARLMATPSLTRGEGQ